MFFLQRFTYLSCRGACLFRAKPYLTTDSREFSILLQYTKHDKSIGSIHENTASKSNFNSFAQHLENSFYDSNKNNPDKVSNSHNVKTSAKPPYNQREGIALFLLYLHTPCWLPFFSSLVSYKELHCCPLFNTNSSLF